MAPLDVCPHVFRPVTSGATMLDTGQKREESYGYHQMGSVSGT